PPPHNPPPGGEGVSRARRDKPPRPITGDPPAPLPSVPPSPADARVCGNCKLWQPHSVDHRGWVGPCRLQPSRGLFPPSAPICDYFAPKGVASAIRSAAETPRRQLRNVAPAVIRRSREPQASVDLGGDLNMTREDLLDMFREAGGDLEVPLAPKWEGGVIQILPANRELQGKEMPVDALFHKVVMVRDRLRTLEQKINAHPKLSDAEKVEMQQYITRIYG